MLYMFESYLPIMEQKSFFFNCCICINSENKWLEVNFQVYYVVNFNYYITRSSSFSL